MSESIALSNGVSPWVAAAAAVLTGQGLLPVFRKECHGFKFTVHNTGDALWILAQWPAGGRAALRTAYSPDGKLQLADMEEQDSRVRFYLKASIGDYVITLDFPEPEKPLLHYTVSLQPAMALQIPFWPRDVVPLGRDGASGMPAAQGKVHISQTGPRSGLLYLTMNQPACGSLLYLQNLTGLNDYCRQTETSLCDTVGGQWPELGFALPPARRPLTAGRECVLSDALVIFNTVIPSNPFQLARQFLDLLADVYLHLPRPQTVYQHWPDVLQKTLHDLEYMPGCWSQVKGKAYLNAYVCDYTTPPEIMVQLAVLLPLHDYVEWSGQELPLVSKLEAGLSAFYDERIGTLARWLPAAQRRLDGEEEHKQPHVMDSWYLHHPLLNLSRLALKGDKEAKKLLLRSLPYAIRVAHHFNYRWPVFYNMYNLEVIRAETGPGKGGEKDVPGIYAHVMLQAWQLTGDRRYLEEAKAAAHALMEAGFNLFYQANNTAFAAGAMLRLWKITKDERYLDLSYLCLANIFRNVWLWDCSYGYGKHYPTFFALFPLSNAPYTAVYEEQEGFAAFHDYLAHAEGTSILPAVSLLLPEFIRYMLHRAVYYYPPRLPREMLSEETRTGEVDPDLWIPLEDLYDGWSKAGQVGQEVYGAGLAFGILPRHYRMVHEGPFMLFIDYPATPLSYIDHRTISFTVKGDERLRCRLLLLPLEGQELPSFSVTGAWQYGEQEIAGRLTPEGYLEYCIPGNRQLTIRWENGQHLPRQKNKDQITPVQKEK